MPTNPVSPCTSRVLATKRNQSPPADLRSVGRCRISRYSLSVFSGWACV